VSIYDRTSNLEVSRRGLLRRISAASAGIFAGLATADAEASGVGFYRCCGLATQTKCGSCVNGSANFHCPSGYTQRRWYCCAGSALVMCGECTKASDCEHGPFACSCGATIDSTSNFCF
jgi:hypothetical protein